MSEVTLTSAVRRDETLLEAQRDIRRAATAAS